MTYTHLTPDELVMIEAYAKAHQSVTKTAQMLKRSRQTIYTVYAYLKDGHTALEYYQNYKKNKAKCGYLFSYFTLKQRHQKTLKQNRPCY